MQINSLVPRVYGSPAREGGSSPAQAGELGVGREGLAPTPGRCPGTAPNWRGGLRFRGCYGRGRRPRGNRTRGSLRLDLAGAAALRGLGSRPSSPAQAAGAVGLGGRAGPPLLWPGLLPCMGVRVFPLAGGGSRADDDLVPLCLWLASEGARSLAFPTPARGTDRAGRREGASPQTPGRRAARSRAEGARSPEQLRGGWKRPVGGGGGGPALW